ncbi:MAG TPA: HAD-IC family P-type ATPase, partial [Clostridia bacterium]|nr:HAD-IC family P-type ATPase [Clostridia bacterium]
GFFGGIGGASKKGILVKGGNFLEAMTDIDTVIFDKTGTLTKGVFAVTQINPVPGVGEADLLHYAALAETHSTHPIAISILRAYSGKIDGNQIEDYKEIPGLGITVKTREYVILAGNEGLMKSNDIKYRSTNALGTIVYIAVDGKYMGNIVVSDELKKDAKMAVTRLKGLGVKSLVMLTGDSRKVGEKVAEDLGLDGVYAQLLPHEKVEKLESIEKNKTTGGRLVFVGDGINDAPVLARADVGIAMGGLGSDAAIEAADIVLMTDEPHKLAEAIQISRKTKKIVLQNIVLALSVKGIVLLMGAMGIATMWEAVFADVGVALLAVLNSMRAVR